jgi:hypothetical protein
VHQNLQEEYVAIHNVTMSLPQGLVTNSDVEFSITSDGKKLGEVHLSKGTIDWRPAGAKNGVQGQLGEFAEMMTASARF